MLDVSQYSDYQTQCFLLILINFVYFLAYFSDFSDDFSKKSINWVVFE